MKKTITRLVLFCALAVNTFSAFSQNTIDFGYSVSDICEPAEVTLVDFSSITVFTGPLEYKWFIDYSLAATDQFPLPITLTKGFHMITLEVWDNGVNLGSQNYAVEIYGQINDFLITPGNNICPGQSVHVSINTSTFSILWNSGAVSYFTPTTSNNFETDFTYEKPGTYNITLITSGFCGTDTTIKAITVGNSAVPTITATDIIAMPGCVNDPINFSVNKEYNSYFWEFGDGATSNQRQAQHKYNTATPSDFTAKLTVTNECGGSAFTNFLVQVMDALPADANFDFQPLIGMDNCPGTPVQFNPYGSGAYYWDFGDGSISNERNPVHQFSQTNNYPVTLTVTNGCSNHTSVTNFVNVYTGETWVPNPFFTFDAQVDWVNGQNDTIHICPGHNLGFLNQTFGEPGIKYVWDFGDGQTFYGYNSSHVYSVEGIFEVSLTASNLCGATSTSYKYVVVDAGALPISMLNTVPVDLCVGDKVYFYDDAFDPRNDYTYSVDFGDGNTATGIKDNGDKFIRTLVSHAYAGTGSYDYIFTSTNSCGNSVSANGTILVDNDANRIPFSYIENSTQNNVNTGPPDWSVRKSPGDYEIDIPVSWSSWIPSYGNDFYVFFWYGMFDPISGATGPPDGFVHFNTLSIVAGVSVKAYIPADQPVAPTIGIAAGYYCGNVPRFNDEPEAFGGLSQFGFPVYSLPIVQSGITDLASLNMEVLIDSTWNGVCNSEKIENNWFREVEPGVFAQVSLFDTGFGLNYEFKYTDALVDPVKSNVIENGNYTKTPQNDSVSFYSYFGCLSTGDYRIVKPGPDSIQFIPILDDCVDRLSFLSGVFTKVIQNPVNNNSVCPGDKVQFKVVSGSNYEWHFGDGTTSTLQYPVHTYASEGVYNAFVITGNGCGRQDTLFTKVTVLQKPIENVFFWTSEYEKNIGDSVHFNYEDYTDWELNNNTYLWNFGDGNTSTLKNPAHVYNSPGDYTVTLTVTNGCGPASHSEIVSVRPEFRFCEAQFDATWDGPMYFNDVSIGNPTEWTWDFGDGSYSTEQNPMHTYQKDGSYRVTLTIFNPQTNCVSSVTNNIISGSVDCQADFNFAINTLSGLANFTSSALNATDYYWDFGDGDFSVDANPSHTFKKGIYSVCLTIWNNTNGCMAYICKDLMVMPSDSAFLTAEFSFFNDPSGNTINLYDLSSPNATNWYWTLGDGRMLESQNGAYTYSKPGVYNVCLIVTDIVSKLSSSVCKEIRVGETLCTIASDFTYFINPAVLEVGFLSQASGSVDNYFWSFGDGSSSTSESPSHQYLLPGYYEVTLSVRNSADNCMDKTSRFIQVGNVDCHAGFTYRVIPADNTVNFYDVSKGLIDYYYWDFGNGTYSVEQNPVQLYENAGNYLVGQFVIDNTASCVDVIIQAVQVGEIDCSAAFISYIDSLSSTAYFTNRNLGSSTALLWSFGDGGFSTEENPVHVFPGDGLYSAGLNTYDFNTNCMDYYQEMLLIGGLGNDCEADFVYRVDPNTGIVTFSNKSIGDIVESVWTFGDETEISGMDPVHEYTIGGYYNVCLTVMNSAGIRNMTCKWIYIDGNTANSCRANFMFTVDSATLAAKFVDYSYGDINKYTWNFGDSSADSASILQNPDHIYDQAGFYLVHLQAENTITGCVSNEYKLLNIADQQVLKASFGYEAKLPDKKFTGYPVDLVSASSGDGATVEWDFGDKQLKKGLFTVMDSTHRIITHYYQNPGKYEVCVRISDPVRNISDIYCRYVYTKNAVNTDDFTETGFMLSVYPNPFVDFTTINYSLSKSDNIEIAIFDQLGRKIETLVKANQEPGKYTVTWETKLVTTGVYHLKLITAEEVLTKPLVITR